MDTVSLNKTRCSTSAGPVRTGTGPVDLLGVKIPERKKKKEKRLGYMGKKELIEEVRKIFPNATVLPNEHNKTRQTEERKAL